MTKPFQIGTTEELKTMTAEDYAGIISMITEIDQI